MRILEMDMVFVIVLLPVEITLSLFLLFNNDLRVLSRIYLR